MTTTTTKRYAYRKGQLRTLKTGIDLDAYQRDHPDAYILRAGTKLPCDAKLERWISDCVCPALDGCRVETDGICQHGLPSWLMALGYI